MTGTIDAVGLVVSAEDVVDVTLLVVTVLRSEVRVQLLLPSPELAGSDP